VGQGHGESTATLKDSVQPAPQPFEQITSLTDVAEGTIVRVITRLDETCREVRDAARVIGDADLFKKMEESQIKIKRDSAWHHFRNYYDAQIPCSGCSCFRCKSVFLSNCVSLVICIIPMCGVQWSQTGQ
jgi:hypothetical protein